MSFSSSGSNVALSVAVPVFNEREALPELYRRLKAVLTQIGVSHEIVLVNDGSTDGSWDVILSLAWADPAVKAISLSRNFGHQIAITAALDASTGAAVVVMDADLQDPPELIPALYAKHLEGHDVVYAQRRTREGETWWKRLTAKAFYRIVRRMTVLQMPVDTGDFRLVSGRVVQQLRRMPEQSRFLRGLVTWIGFKQTAVPYDRDRRFGGRSKFSTGKMVKFAMDGITSFSGRPLRLASLLGLLISMATLLFMLGLIVYKLAGGTGVIQGWTSLIVAVLFLGGLQLMAIGIVGEYIGRIYEEVKGRPLYLIDQQLNVSPTTVSHQADHAEATEGTSRR
jgi:glycosyltransferase involved in cell wall biosynthesis